MIRPISLFMLVMVTVATKGYMTGDSPNFIGLVICLLLLPLLSVVAAKCMRCTKITPLFATFAILFSWGASIFVFSWAFLVREYVGEYFILTEFCVLLPAFFWLGVLWFVASPIQNRIAWVSHRFRLDILLLFIPVALLVTISNSISLFGFEKFDSGIQLVSFFILLSCAPFFVTRILSTKPMKNYQLQCSIIEVGYRSGLRKIRIFVWNTHNRIMNALAIGILFQPKTIVLTDKLIATLSTKELLSVTAHEFGHHKYWHIPCMILTAVTAMLWLDRVYRFMHIELGGAFAMVTQLAGVVLAIVLVSRQFEEQADAYAAVDNSREFGDGCITNEGAMIMASALGTLAQTQNIDMYKNDPLHGSIALRQQRLHALIGCSFSELPINKRVFYIKVFLGVSFLVGIIL
jgi:Zn-dependent protease with chaperone function